MNEEPIRLTVEFLLTREEMSALESYTDEMNHKRISELLGTCLKEEATFWGLKNTASKSKEYYIRRIVDEKLNERIKAFEDLKRQQDEFDRELQRNTE